MIETFERKFGARVIHVWGMTETSPVATVCAPLRKHAGAALNDRLSLQVKQGRVPYGAEIRLVNDDGRTIPSDGTAAGHLLVRGHWIASEYFGGEGGRTLDEEGWFDTGDIATVDATATC